MNKRMGISGDERRETCSDLHNAADVHGISYGQLRLWAQCGEIPLAYKSRSGKKYYRNDDIVVAINGGKNEPDNV